MLLIKILVIIATLAIFFEDLYTKSVHWYLFAVLCGAILTIVFQSGNSMTVIGYQSFENLLFIMGLLLFVTVYIALRWGKLVNLTKGYFCWGDILLLASLAPFFSFVNYVIFFVASTAMTICIWTAARVILRLKATRVPLAGFQALFFMVIFIASWLGSAMWADMSSWIFNKVTA